LNRAAQIGFVLVVVLVLDFCGEHFEDEDDDENKEDSPLGADRN